MALPIPVAVSCGDPSGVGTELILQSWLALNQTQQPFFIIHALEFVQRVQKLLALRVPIIKVRTPQEVTLDLFRQGLPVLDLKLAQSERLSLGVPSASGAQLALTSLELACKYVQNGDSSALVTLPIDKSRMQEVGFGFPGHTEFLAHQAGVAKTVMMLCGEQPTLKVVPVTGHVALAEAVRSLSPDLIIETITLVRDYLKRLLKIEPTLAILGLNPHAGEGGLLGSEEITIIGPAIKKLKQLGFKVCGPLPADGAMAVPNIKQADVFIGMYHDQVLVPFKALCFNSGVNCTLGLPFMRTSPCHGTAFAIAGRHLAKPDSVVAAIKLASSLGIWRAGHGQD